jgi:hypothetical protein
MRAALGGLATMTLLLIGIACTDRSAPTEPRTPRTAAAVTAAAAVAISGEEIEDALTRVLPALIDDGASLGLRRALDELLEALSGTDRAPATAALKRAEAVLEAYSRAAGPESGEAADIDVIGLALARVGQRLEDTR